LVRSGLVWSPTNLHLSVTDQTQGTCLKLVRSISTCRN